MPVYVNVDSIDDSFVNDKLKNNDIFFTEDLGYSIDQIQKVDLLIGLLFHLRKIFTNM